MSDDVAFTGAKGLARAIEAGVDPNADLEEEDRPTRIEAAVNLKLAGASYTDIAKTLGYASAYRARSAVEKALAGAESTPEEREIARILAEKRLSKLLSSVMSKALNPKEKDHLAYNARALAIIDRQIKLWGLDAPTQIQVSATDQEILQLIEVLSPTAETDKLQVEAEIINADEAEIM
jgi:hypothetical protein